MAANQATHDDDGINGINITPLVDITLVLLIIFMVCAKLIQSQSIAMDLPKAAGGQGTQTTFVVAIDPERHVSLDGNPVTDDKELSRRAAEAIARDHDLRTVIQASARVDHGTVIHVLDELQQAGISKIAFAIDKTDATATR